MSLVDKNTLRYHMSRSLFRVHDLSKLYFPEVMKTAAPFTDANTISPLDCAMEFYLGNHCMSLVRQQYGEDEPLPEEVLDLVDDYVSHNSVSAYKMFCYLLYITIREARHVKSSSSLFMELSEKFGGKISDFFHDIRGTSYSHVWAELRSNPPDAAFGDVVGATAYIFEHGGFSSGYGGKAWWSITKCLQGFVEGSYSAEIMLDTSFTLCHNNGPIFNKGKVFDNVATEKLMMLLDVQRAGQVPQYVWNEAYHDSKARAILNMSMVALGENKVLPTKEVDWVLVDEYGEGNYGYQIMKSGQGKKKKKKAVLPKVTPGPVVDNESDIYQITPGLSVHKVIKVRETA